MAERRPIRWPLIVLGVLALALLLFAVLHKKKAPAKPTPPTSVNVAQVTAQDLPVTITGLGAAQAWRSDTIVAQVSGILLRAPFKEGDTVHAGQLLAEIDPAPYRAALMQAQGALRRDQATLEEARLNLSRYEALLAKDSIARQTVEDQRATVKQDEGVVLIDQGAVAAAQVNVARTRIRSPITGRIGVRLVDPGNLVGSGSATNSTNGSSQSVSTSSGSTAGAASGAAGSSGSVTGGTTGTTGIAVVNELQPIAVTFTVPQSDFANLVRVSNGFRTPLLTEAYTQETNELIGSGALQIADNKVDPSTGTVQLKARFANADERIWPGEFLNVKLTLQTLHQVPVVPAGAVNRGPEGVYVFVVQNGVAHMRKVKTSTTQNGMAVIDGGLNLGEVVVVDGQLTLKNGSHVQGAATRPEAERPGPPEPRRAARPPPPPPRADRRFVANLSTPFIKRPVATSLIAVAFLLIGIAAYFSLPVAALPQVDFPTIQVSASLPGASPETMASNVATPLERQFATIQDLAQMTSTSSLGSSSVTLQFNLNRNIDAAAQDVQAAINAAGGQLPTNLPAPPTIRKVNPADAPIMIIGLRSDTLPIQTVNDYADNILSQHISIVPGVGQVIVGGQQKPAMRIQLDPQASRRPGPADGHRAHDDRQPDGERAQGLDHRAAAEPDGLRQRPDLRRLGLEQPRHRLQQGQRGGGARARRRPGHRRRREQPGRRLDVSRQARQGPGHRRRPGDPADRLQAARRQRHPDGLAHPEGACRDCARACRPGSRCTIVADRTQTIRAAVSDVKVTLLITIVLVVAGDLPVPARRPRDPDPERGDPAGPAGDRWGSCSRCTSASTTCR